MIIAALTGPIASGKSAVLALFQSFGVPCISTDVLVHSLQQANTPQTQAVAAKFGLEVLLPDGALNRAKLTEMAAHNPNVFPYLEEIFHPPLKHMVAEFVAQHTSHPLVVVEIPLLFQKPTGHIYHVSVATICPKNIRQRRARHRAGMTTEKFNLINARQPALSVFKKRADYLINTDGTMDNTTAQVHQLYSRLLDLNTTLGENSVKES